MKPKILVVLGPTATGKSDLAVKLAKQFKGEIISADSRQVYKGLNIGSGKITKKEMSGIPHYLLDVVSPKTIFSVAQFKKKSEKLISDILKREKLPILAGGTAFYIESIVDGIVVPEVKPNKTLRNKLEKKTAEELFKILKKKDSRRAKEIDPKNKRRLIRSLEIIDSIGKVPKTKTDSRYNTLQIGLDWPDEILKKRINERLLTRMKIGMVAEVRNLHKKGLSWKRLESLGLEYKHLALFLQKKITKAEMLERINTESWHFAKRQRTWFKKDKRIKWFKPTEIAKIKKLTKDFLN